MKVPDRSSEPEETSRTVRRLVVSDNLRESPREVRGRRLESPPATKTEGLGKTFVKRKSNPLRTSYVLAGLGACALLIAVLVLLPLRSGSAPKVGASPPMMKGQAVVEPKVASNQSDELRRIEEEAKQVIRRISSDDKSYSFSEGAIKDIQSRAQELSRASDLSESLSELQAKAQAIGSQSAKEGLRPSLVILIALALTEGGESGDSAKAAINSLPQLASLNKTFGSADADSCLILIAAFREGPGTHRSHPLLRRMNRVITNPLNERNVWYLNDQNALAPNAYALVVDTIAYGVIARNPRQFGLQNDPFNF